MSEIAHINLFLKIYANDLDNLIDTIEDDVYEVDLCFNRIEEGRNNVYEVYYKNDYDEVVSDIIEFEYIDFKFRHDEKNN